MIENPGDLGEQYPDILRSQRHLAGQQLFHGEAVAMFLTHHRDVVETIEIRQRLKIGLILDELLRAPVQQADMGIGALDHFAVHFQHQAQHAGGRRMLRPEVHREVIDQDFSHRRPTPYRRLREYI